MKRLFKTKKRVALLVSIAALAAAAGAYAYFTSTGSGSGTGSTATPATLTIQQIGAGYDSLIPNNTYSQDQCFGCASITQFGNEVNLANAPAGTYAQVTTVVVAFRNWGPAFTGVPITLNIGGGASGGGYSDTVTPSFPGATGPTSPSTTNVTFNFDSQNAFETSPLVVGVAFDSSGAAGSLNVALSDSNYDVSVGTDSVPGSVWVEGSGPGLDGDAPSCAVPPASPTFGATTVDCGPQNPGNPGAYGNYNGVTDNADIPAIEVNDVGGTAPDLSPGVTGVPVDFAIFNPGTTAVQVSTVTATITANSKSGSGCNSGWYTLSPGNASTAQVTLNTTVQPGTTFFNPSGLALNMPSLNTNQNACIGATVDLGFTTP